MRFFLSPRARYLARHGLTSPLTVCVDLLGKGATAATISEVFWQRVEERGIEITLQDEARSWYVSRALHTALAIGVLEIRVQQGTEGVEECYRASTIGQTVICEL